jgi:hypothetical protein
MFVVSPFWRYNLLRLWEQTRGYGALFASGIVLLFCMASLLAETRNLSAVDRVLHQHSAVPPVAAAADKPLAVRAPAVVEAKSGAVPAGGASAILPVTISNVDKLGAITVVVGYDPALLKPVQCRRNSLFSTGLCNLLFDIDNDGTPDAVRFNVISLEGVSVASGSVVNLVEVTWEAVGSPTVGATTPLNVTVDSIANTEGLPLNVSSQPGVITFVEAPTPTPTTAATPAATATHTPTPTPTQSLASSKDLYLPVIFSRERQ